MNTVRIYDFDTKKITEIPESELAPGYVHAVVAGIEGHVWILASSLKHSPYRHPPFGEEYQEIFQDISIIFAEVHPMSVAEWEDGFRRDTDPMQEIELWGNVAGAFKYFTEGKSLSPAVKKDIFSVILSVYSNGHGNALDVVQLVELTRGEAVAIVERLKRGRKQGDHSND